MEAAVDKRLAGAAPDFAAALRLINEAAKPSGAVQGGGNGQPLDPSVAQPDDFRDFVAELARQLNVWKKNALTRAGDAYERMGKCVALTRGEVGSNERRISRCFWPAFLAWLLSHSQSYALSFPIGRS